MSVIPQNSEHPAVTWSSDTKPGQKWSYSSLNALLFKPFHPPPPKCFALKTGRCIQLSARAARCSPFLPVLLGVSGRDLPLLVTLQRWEALSLFRRTKTAVSVLVKCCGLTGDYDSFHSLRMLSFSHYSSNPKHAQGRTPECLSCTGRGRAPSQVSMLLSNSTVGLFEQKLESGDFEWQILINKNLKHC